MIRLKTVHYCLMHYVTGTHCKQGQLHSKVDSFLILMFNFIVIVHGNIPSYGWRIEGDGIV